MDSNFDIARWISGGHVLKSREHFVCNFTSEMVAIITLCVVVTNILNLCVGSLST